MSTGLQGCASYCMKACSVWETRGLRVPFYEVMKYARGSEGRRFDILFYDGMTSVPHPEGFHVLFHDTMRSVQKPGGFDVLFYDSMRRAPGPEEFKVLLI